MSLLIGEEVLEDMKSSMNSDVRVAKIINVNLNYDTSSQDQNIVANQQSYGTIDLQFLDFPGVQTTVRLPTTQFSKSSGRIDIPEVNMMALCIFMPNSKAVVLSIFSLGDDTQDFLFLRDFVSNGILPQLQQGDSVTWSGNKAFHFVRTCTKKIVQTIGKLLDSTKAPIQINGKDIHYNLEHETGTKFSYDSDGNLIITLAPGQKMYVNKDGSSATDEDAIVTKAFINTVWNNFVSTVFNIHTHVVTTAPGTTAVPIPIETTVSPAMPDGVSTPDIRVKGA